MLSSDGRWWDGQNRRPLPAAHHDRALLCEGLALVGKLVPPILICSLPAIVNGYRARRQSPGLLGPRSAQGTAVRPW